MSKLLVYLKDFLTERIEFGEEVSATFMKRSVEEEKNFTMTADSKEGAANVIDKVISLGYKN